MIRGTTQVVAVIGDPVDHSLSPAIHNAAFRATGLDWVYVALPVASGRGGEAVAALGVLGLRGLNVTMPHKDEAARACDEVSAAAARLASVNTVVRRDDGALFGDSTDGEGFLRSLRDAGVDVRSRSALVLGAGGAARAVAWALATEGANTSLWGRRPAAASASADLAGVRHEASEDLDAVVAGVDLVVNATPVGMRGEAPLFAPGAVGAGQVVADLVYEPRATPLLTEAAKRGATVVDGLGMLVHQAALSFALWTGSEAPVEAMRTAAEEALTRTT